MTARRVGIREVAAAAGVSHTTVSHILNDVSSLRASNETKQRVKDAAERLGYRPNRLARGLATRSSGMIGLITEEIAATAHAGGIIRGAQEAAAKHGLTLAIVNAELSPDASNAGEDVEALLDRQVDGLIYATVFHREITPPTGMRTAPSILIGAVDTNGVLPSIVPDEEGGARSALQKLLELGHRRIGFIRGDDHVPATWGRESGYRQALATAGLPVDEDLIVSGEAEAAGGYTAAMELLSPHNRPTALFCYNDRMSMGVYRAAAELGLTIPDDLSIIGFDNQEPIASSLYPGLTTVALPHAKMGAWAVDALVGAIETSSLPTDRPPQTLEPCTLEWRASASAPSGASRLATDR